MARGSSKSRARKPSRKIAQPSSSPVTINGWTILAHPLFISQIDKLVAEAGRELAKGVNHGPNAKLLGHLLDLAFDKIPQDPSNQHFRQGKTLGAGYKHWSRAKTGGGRYRLFFRYSKSARVILYVWVNDEGSLRTYGSTTDAYSVFSRMLASGNPPDDWDALVAAANASSISKKLHSFADILRGNRPKR